MEKKWDTVIPAELKRVLVSGTYVPLVTKGLNTKDIKIYFTQERKLLMLKLNYKYMSTKSSYVLFCSLKNILKCEI